MKMKLLVAAAALALAGAANAHEIWVERDGSGPARVYLGEPGDVLPDGGDPEFGRLKAPRFLPALAAAPERRAGYLEAAVADGDVRVTDDTIFAPWDNDGKREGIVYFAKAGNVETEARLPVEFVPTAPGAASFRLVQDGVAVGNADVTVITPDKWSKTLRTGADGVVEVPVREAGRYLLSAALKQEGDLQAGNGEAIAVLHKVSTVTFTAQ